MSMTFMSHDHRCCHQCFADIACKLFDMVQGGPAHQRFYALAIEIFGMLVHLEIIWIVVHRIFMVLYKLMLL